MRRSLEDVPFGHRLHRRDCNRHQPLPRKRVVQAEDCALDDEFRCDERVLDLLGIDPVSRNLQLAVGYRMIL